MSSYISARFEKDDLPTSGQVRVVCRNIDDGTVPPLPTSTYFPTYPDDQQTFIVVEYVSDLLGERFNRVASLSDFTTLSASYLTAFEDTTVDFTAAGVMAGDVIEVFLTDPEPWTSEEYPGSTFQFEITSVSATKLQISRPFPNFRTGLRWEISARGLTGLSGATRRNVFPAPGTLMLDWRFNSYFTGAVEALNFVASTKAAMTVLANESTGSGLVPESYTAEPR